MKFTVSRLVWSGLVSTTKWWSGLLGLTGGLVTTMASESYSNLTGINLSWGLFLGGGGLTYAILRLLMAMFNTPYKSGRFNIYSSFMACMIVITCVAFQISRDFNPEQLLVMLLVGCMVLWVALCAVVLKLLRLCRDANLFMVIMPWQDAPDLAEWMWGVMCRYNSAFRAKTRCRLAKSACFEILNKGGMRGNVELLNHLLGTNIRVRWNTSTVDVGSTTPYYQLTVEPGGWSNLPANGGD